MDIQEATPVTKGFCLPLVVLKSTVLKSTTRQVLLVWQWMLLVSSCTWPHHLVVHLYHQGEICSLLHRRDQ